MWAEKSGAFGKHSNDPQHQLMNGPPNKSGRIQVTASPSSVRLSGTPRHFTPNEISNCDFYDFQVGRLLWDGNQRKRGWRHRATSAKSWSIPSQNHEAQLATWNPHGFSREELILNHPATHHGPTWQCPLASTPRPRHMAAGLRLLHQRPESPP